MAITIDFSKKYADLICPDIPKVQLSSYPGMDIPEKYKNNLSIQKTDLPSYSAKNMTNLSMKNKFVSPRI